MTHAVSGKVVIKGKHGISNTVLSSYYMLILLLLKADGNRLNKIFLLYQWILQIFDISV